MEVTAPLSVGRYFMKKPQPWKKLPPMETSEQVLQKKANVNHLCRVLRVSKTPAMFKSKSRLHNEKVKNNGRHRHKEMPFLIRNCTNGRDHWDDYERQMKQWAINHQTKPRERKAMNEAVEEDSPQGSKMKVAVLPQKGSNAAIPDTEQDSKQEQSNISFAHEEDLLRSFYTLWNMRRVSTKETKTFEQANEAMQQLANSPIVDHCMSRTPNGGITVVPITDRETLSKRAELTLGRLARLLRDDDGPLDVSDTEDPVDVWNRAVESVQSNSRANLTENAENRTSTGPAMNTFATIESPISALNEPSTETPKEKPSSTRKVRSADRINKRLLNEPMKTSTPRGAKITVQELARESVENVEPMDTVGDVNESANSGYDSDANATDGSSSKRDEEGAGTGQELIIAPISRDRKELENAENRMILENALEQMRNDYNEEVYHRVTSGNENDANATVGVLRRRNSTATDSPAITTNDGKKKGSDQKEAEKEKGAHQKETEKKTSQVSNRKKTPGRTPIRKSAGAETDAENNQNEVMKSVKSGRNSASSAKKSVKKGTQSKNLSQTPCGNGVKRGTNDNNLGVTPLASNSKRTRLPTSNIFKCMQEEANPIRHSPRLAQKH